MSTPYRNEIDALRERKASLEAEIAKLRDQTTRLDELKAREAELAGELAGIDGRLNAGMPKRGLPLLDQVRVASPCKAEWNEMLGDERVRFCLSCEKNVYNLSSMTKDDAESLLRERLGNDLCVRFYQRSDGTILTADCPDGVVRRRRKKRLVALTFGAMSVAAAATSVIHGRTRVMMGAPPPSHVTMGKLSLAVPVGPVEPPVMVMGEPAPMPRMGAVAMPPQPHVKMGKLKAVK